MSNVSTTTAAIYQAVLDSLYSSGECGVLPPAPPGKSAYEVAVDNGFVGSEKQWLDSLTLEQENEIARLEARILANENYRKDSKNAASRLVGAEKGRVPLSENVAEAYLTSLVNFTTSGYSSIDDLPAGTKVLVRVADNQVMPIPGIEWHITTELQGGHPDDRRQIAWTNPSTSRSLSYTRCYILRNKAWSDWYIEYSSSSTTKDSKTNLLLETGDTIPSDSAASRLVGSGKEQLPWGGLILESLLSSTVTLEDSEEIPSPFKSEVQVYIPVTANKPPGTHNAWAGGSYWTTFAQRIDESAMRYDAVSRTSPEISLFRGLKNGNFTSWYFYYGSHNTTVDSNKNIKTSSPVVRVFSDHLDKIHEANQLPIKYTRNGVGDYTIEGTTGLRENDWQIVIPKDDHDNQLIAFTIEDDNGTIQLKTYKRTFSMETFLFGPDLNSPVDIPEGRWVDLHFNNIPQEELDEPELEEEPIEDEEEETEAVDEPVEKPEVLEEPEVNEPEVSEEDPVVVEEDPKD